MPFTDSGARALTALRQAENDYLRRSWRYYRDFDLLLASVRNEPKFKAVFADIERDMARHRADLAKRVPRMRRSISPPFTEPVDQMTISGA